MFADVLIEHGFARKQNQLTYLVPDTFSLHPGDGVIVPFLNQKKPAVVLNIHTQKPPFETKEVLGLLQDEQLLFSWQLQLMEWISEYYFCSKYDAVRLLMPKNVFRIPKKSRTRKQERKVKKAEPALELTPAQSELVTGIQNGTRSSLIHGVTGAGKTEIYKSLIKKIIQDGKQCLLLAPEISLTPQLLRYFEASFPEIAVIHSKISDGKRAEYWKKIRDGQIKLVIGSRSALFSPFKNLGLIVIDEEHEWSYKQDQSPRYHAREVSFKIAELTGAKLVLGSATPSIESYFMAKEGKLDLYTLRERIAGTPLPKVKIVDMREELHKGNFSMFSDLLEQKIRSTLALGEQIILFLNRRGSASSLLCRDCGYVFMCPNCDIAMTYHARTLKVGSLICHHCGKVEALKTNCPHCHGTRVKYLGLGTERVETELKKLFPTARIKRADRDTMSKKDSFTELHQALQAGEIDILLGTQMIGKGFDIPNVTLVGVIMADLGLHIPDFRTPERMFQLLTQVAGRAGRRKKQGEVLIQSYNPDHPSIFYSQSHDYIGFYEQEINSRRAAGYPPFGKLVKLMFSHEKASICEEEAKKLASLLPKENHRVYAVPALLSRINNKYQWNVLLEGPTPRELLAKLRPEQLNGWRIDVDPLLSI